MADNEELNRAIQMIKSGDKVGAGQLLRNLLKQNRKNERAWLWMSACVDTQEDQRYCLEQVLIINPKNDVARKGLEKIGGGATAARGKPVQAKNPTWVWMMAAATVIGLLLVCIAGTIYLPEVKNLIGLVNNPPFASANPSADQPSPPSSFTRYFMIRLKATGTAKQATILKQGSGRSAERLTVNLPWEETYQANEGDYVSFAVTDADNTVSSGATFTCEIEVDWQPLDKHNSRAYDNMAACSAQLDPASFPATSLPGEREVKLMAEGKEQMVRIVYETTNENFETIEKNEVTEKLPWSKTFQLKDGYSVFFVVDTPGKGNGAITCKVLVDGKVVANKVSSDPLYPKVMCPTAIRRP